MWKEVSVTQFLIYLLNLDPQIPRQLVPPIPKLQMTPWFDPMHISTPAPPNISADSNEMVRVMNEKPTAFATPSKFPSTQVSTAAAASHKEIPSNSFTVFGEVSSFLPPSNELKCVQEKSKVTKR